MFTHGVNLKCIMKFYIKKIEWLVIWNDPSNIVAKFPSFELIDGHPG